MATTRSRQSTPAPPTPKTTPKKKAAAAPPPAKSDNYGSEGVTDNDISKLEPADWNTLIIVTVLGVFVRMFRLSQPTSVVFDEVHFGGFASKYIKGRFFMDVHPPLAKLLLTLAGWLAGFDGEFDFKDIGKDYVKPGVPYVAMRFLPAICGVLTIPTVFLTLKVYGCRTTTAAFGAGLIMFENGLVTQSRLILLDSPLIFFTAFTSLAWTAFTNTHEQGPHTAFTTRWWTWLALSGLGLGATVSVKWVGLFTIAWVGSLTALQLWVLLGDSRNVTPRLWFKHFFARVFCLIVIPVTFYMAMFAIHFTCLVNPGEGDGFMSSEFQSTLNTKGMQDVPADVAFGSRISLRHHNTAGGYLHSHNHMYPGGSQQQQVTLYPHRDENNVWIFENQTQPIGADGIEVNGSTAWDTLDPTYITDGSTLRIYHILTDRRLHSHDVRPPISEAEWQNEVSAYGYTGFDGDANDYFRVEIVKSLSDGDAAKQRVRTIQTKFRLIHVMTGCALFSHKVKLPDWGFEQQEVTCAKQGTLPNSIWYVETNEHPAIGIDAEVTNYRNPGFFGKFFELNRVMWTTNAGLVESHTWDSRPTSWPILSRGINFWGKGNRQIYLIGNPLIWLSSTAAILVYVAFKGIAVLRWQRSCGDYNNANFKRFDYEIGQTILGWAFHYFPFYLMQRQLFLHHYFPALVFAIMALCQIYDFATTRIGGFGIKERPVIGQAGIAIFLGLSIVVFSLYAPLAYGNKWTKGECQRAQLLETWDWDCNNFLDSYSDYAALATRNTDVPATNAAHAGPAPPVADDPKDDVNVTPQAESTHEQLEYHDENGKLLNAEEVAALEGKVSFSTRYETRTRLLDAAGNEIKDGAVPVEIPAKAEAEDPKTFMDDGVDVQQLPVDNDADLDIEKNRKLRTGDGEASPEQPVVAATGKDEL